MKLRNLLWSLAAAASLSATSSYAELIVVTGTRIYDAYDVAGSMPPGAGCSQNCDQQTLPEDQVWNVNVIDQVDLRCVGGYGTVTSYSNRSLQLEAMAAANSAINGAMRALMSALTISAEMRYADGGLERFVPSYSGSPTPVSGTWQGGSGAPNGTCPG